LQSIEPHSVSRGPQWRSDPHLRAIRSWRGGGQIGESPGMTLALEDLPDDVAALKALLLAERAQTDRLRHLLAQLRRAHFGRKSEKIDADQLNLGLEDIETAVAAEEAKLENADAVLRAANTKKRKTNRGHLPSHLPRVKRS
jgi:hypothetical protein